MRVVTKVFGRWFVFGVVLFSSLAWAGDSDGDGIDDTVDNCRSLANPGQRDSDGDGFGNRCDADLNDDGVVDVRDLAILKSVFFGQDADGDLSEDADQRVNFADLAILRAALYTSPGPASTSQPDTADAVRLLMRASFGPDAQSIYDVQRMGITGWVDWQLNMGSAYDSSIDGWKTHLERTIEISKQFWPDQFPETVEAYVTQGNGVIFNAGGVQGRVYEAQMSAWLGNALEGEDQLRQRVAYALSQIVVTSTADPVLSRRGESLAYYADILARHAFGNYRDLLLDVAKSPTMGLYLTHQGNKKADPVAGTQPDENFARELMQLFTVGLYRMNLDGTPQLDASGKPIPTYTQTDIEELSRVMTGWDLAGNSRYGDARANRGDHTQPMEFTAEFHDFGSKTIMGSSIPGGLSGEADLQAAINLLVAHPNTAPFISKLLIQRLVTANPSPAYVQRVAQAFRDNGSGVSGDLKAVTRAILLDPEALATHTPGEHFGKPKEPFLALTQMLRTFEVRPLEGWLRTTTAGAVPLYDAYHMVDITGGMGQAPLRAPSVFNFYSPFYIPSDSYFTANKLVAPEFQIQTDQQLVRYSNFIEHLLSNYETNAVEQRYASYQEFLDNFVNGRSWRHKIMISFDRQMALFERSLEGDLNGDFSRMDVTALDPDGLRPKTRAVNALLDHLDILLTGGQLTAEQKSRIATFLVYYRTRSKAAEAKNVILDAIRAIVMTNTYMFFQ